ncbi:hypothetical protein V0288_14370 [Pannus brasiliensis CCIBt3594]|uniref:Uncharacterized protein n=1 Tax=Pannus brasiliensis CCIBt3594 TaxID=1427578 RepID=A0AAW9QTU5_9CHRO
MKNIQHILTALVLLSGLSLQVTTRIAGAQQGGQDADKEQLEYCVSQLTVQVAQIQAIEAIKKQPNLTKAQRLIQIGQILSPAQKQQLEACMSQPMRPPSAPPQG